MRRTEIIAQIKDIVHRVAPTAKTLLYGSQGMKHTLNRTQRESGEHQLPARRQIESCHAESRFRVAEQDCGKHCAELRFSLRGK